MAVRIKTVGLIVGRLVGNLVGVTVVGGDVLGFRDGMLVFTPGTTVGIFSNEKRSRKWCNFDVLQINK